MAGAASIPLFEPGDSVCFTCVRCGREYDFEMVPGQTTKIKCPCGQMVGAEHDMLIIGIDRWADKILGDRKQDVPNDH